MLQVDSRINSFLFAGKHRAGSSWIKAGNFWGQGSRDKDRRVKPEEETRRLKDKSRRGPLSSTNAYSKLKAD